MGFRNEKEGAMTEEWWIKYIPKPLESMEVFVQRVTNFEEMEFVMMEVTQDELETVAASYAIIKPRFSYNPRLYVVMVIRDLIFLTYTGRWQNGSN
jgi:hypothetical protein